LKKTARLLTSTNILFSAHATINRTNHHRQRSSRW